VNESSSRKTFQPWKLIYKFAGVELVFVLAFSFFTGMEPKYLVLLAIIMIGVALGMAKILFNDDLENIESDLDSMKSDLQKKSEALSQEREEIEVLMAAVPEAILAIDQNMKVLFFNSRFAVLFGDTKTEKPPLLGELFRLPDILEVFRTSLKEGKNTNISTEIRTLSDKQNRFFSLSVTPLRRDEKSPAYAAVGIFHDVTELKQAEKIRIDFVANVSHELRTPLTAIKGYTDTLASDIHAKNFGSVDKYIEVINRNSDRLMSLIEDLLDLSSLEQSEDESELTGDRELSNITTVNVRDVTHRIVTQLEPRRLHKNHQIETAFHTDYVHADPRRLEQVLTNLIDNAIKYVPQGGKIRVQWQKGDNAVFLRVIDNGPGIPAKDQTRLFERFFRIDKARSREMGGTGLGLAIVKHIMQKHGGNVRVESELGKGTEFICEFPEDPNDANAPAKKTNQILT
jgi:two-component system phosphate regulon sensor histidine kinase PhoR